MRVAAYVRVSTDEQADKGNSLVEQRERLEAYCKAMGWEKPQLFVDDGYSAKDMNRPAAQKMIAEIRKAKFDIVLTSKLDRMSRNLLDMLQLIDFLEDHSCSYVSAAEGFDNSTAVGRMVMQLLAVFAEFERERTRERVKDNMNSLARNTDKALSIPCFGYDLIDGKYVINEDEAVFVKLMFDLAEEGHGHRMIAKLLNERGARTKRGKLWDQTNVKRLIKTETISGIRVHNRRETKNGKTVMRDKSEWIIKENNHPAIISPEKRLNVLRIMESRKPANKHADSETYLLTGVVKCGHCNRNMKGATSRVRREKSYDYFRYICASYVNGYGCKYHAVHRDDIEKQIINEIKRLTESSEKELEIVVAPSSSGFDEIKEIESQLIKINNRIQKHLDAYSEELISAADLKAASVRSEKERSELNHRLRRAIERKSNKSEIQRNAEMLLGDIQGIDRTRAKAAIRKLINQIIVENGDTISIVWNSVV